MRRADRLFSIVQYFRSRRLTTAQWLSEHLNVSLRTVYRDVQDLMTSGLPIQGEAGVGYALREKIDLPPLQFNRNELAAISLGLRFVVGRIPNPRSQAASTALAKIRSILPDNLLPDLNESRIFVPVKSTVDKNIFSKLDSALTNNQKIALHYEDEGGRKTSRTIYPLALFYWGRAWTMVGWCELRKDFRQFRLERIQSMSLKKERFQLLKGQTLQDFFNQMRIQYKVPLAAFDPELVV